jgi:curli biogenesis system outer membrane secretion channel CsgG
MKKLALLAFSSLLLVSVAAAQPRLKLRLAVAPLDWSEHNTIDNWMIPVEFRNAIYEKLVKRLLDTGRFIVLEREAMEALLNEKAIKEENTGASQKGKIVPAQALVKGKVTDFALDSKGGGGRVGVGGTLGGIGLGVSTREARVGINVRIFDVDTSEMIASETAARSVKATGFSVGGWINSVGGDFGAYEKSPLGEATTKAIDDAVKKILEKLQDRPWSAAVADYDEDTKEITINAGAETGIRVGDVFEVYRVTRVVRDPETGEILGKKTAKSGAIRITSVEKKFAVATVVEGTEFNVGDVVKENRRP